MEKQLILFDFDKTLFNIKSYFADQLFPAAERELKMSGNVLENISKDYRETLTRSTQFDPEGWLEVAKRHGQFDVESFRELMTRPEFFQRAVFPEVFPSLTQLSQTYVLGIYSEANYNWQMKKLELSGLINYFDQKYISISNDKTSDEVIADLPVGAIVIDDKLEVIAALKRREEVHPIWINRRGLQGLTNVHEIRDLTQLARVVEEIIRENQQSG